MRVVVVAQFPIVRIRSPHGSVAPPLFGSKGEQGRHIRLRGEGVGELNSEEGSSEWNCGRPPALLPTPLAAVRIREGWLAPASFNRQYTCSTDPLLIIYLSRILCLSYSCRPVIFLELFFMF
jgi:hypothetical protein